MESVMVAITISVLSFFLSITVAYAAYFRPPKIQMLIGSSVRFYPLPEFHNGKIEWGGIGFYIPLTFHNWSPTGGSIMETRLIIERKDNPSVNYDMSWTMFTGCHETEMKWINLGVAQPIAINGKSSDSKFVLFTWRRVSGEVFNVEPGEYVLKILAWTAKDRYPSIKEQTSFMLTKSMVEEHQKYKNENTPLTVEAPLGESTRINTVLSREQVKGLYKL